MYKIVQISKMASERMNDMQKNIWMELNRTIT